MYKNILYNIVLLEKTYDQNCDFLISEFSSYISERSNLKDLILSKKIYIQNEKKYIILYIILYINIGKNPSVRLIKRIIKEYGIQTYYIL